MVKAMNIESFEPRLSASERISNIKKILPIAFLDGIKAILLLSIMTDSNRFGLRTGMSFDRILMGLLYLPEMCFSAIKQHSTN